MMSKGHDVMVEAPSWTDGRRSRPDGAGPGPRVVHISRSGVIREWRERDRALRRQGADLVLVSASRWNEGGAVVELDASDEEFPVVAARTWGSHPNLFVYDPRPIWRVLRARPVDVVDAHEEPCSLAAAEIGLLRRLLQPSAPLVLYSAQNIFKRYPWPFRMLERMALAMASGAYVCNEEAGRILRAKGFRGRVALLPLGVDVDRFTPGTAGGVDHTPSGRRGLRIGYVGRLEARKGVEVILEAMAEEPDWSLQVVGEGEHRGFLQGQAKDLDLEGRVEFRGHVAQQELVGLYRTFDVVVVPSLPTPSWEEQFCRVAVEAMASGVPVVASATGALPEVVADGGLLFPPGDVAALRQALRELTRDPPRRHELGRRGRARSRLFSWEAVAEGQRALYDAVLS